MLSVECLLSVEGGVTGGVTSGKTRDHYSRSDPCTRLRSVLHIIPSYTKKLSTQGFVSPIFGLMVVGFRVVGLPGVWLPPEESVLDRLTPTYEPCRGHRNVRRFRGGLVFKARRWLYHSRVIKEKTWRGSRFQQTVTCECNEKEHVTCECNEEEINDDDEPGGVSRGRRDLCRSH